MKIAEKRLAGRATPRAAASRTARALMPVVLAALVGCAEPEPEQLLPVQLMGDIRVPDGTSDTGTLHVVVYQAWSGEGESRHALEPLESFQAEAGAFRRRFDYPLNAGEGLVVWAWLDTDGDGVLCAPSSGSEPAGVTVVDPFPTTGDEPPDFMRLPGGLMVEQRIAERVEVTLELSQPCRAAESLFPGASAHRQDK